MVKKGFKHSKETKAKMSANRKGKCIGKDHPKWIGEKPFCIDCNKQLKVHKSQEKAA